jgi:hypothetical protein
MLDLQSYLLYELYLSRRRELADEEARRHRIRASRPGLLSRAFTSLGHGLAAASARALKRHQEPIAGRRVQPSN